MLTETFEEPLAQILEVLPKSRQTLFFSATITQCIEKLKSGKSELTFIDANPNEESLENLSQLYVFVPKSVQVNYLHHLLRDHFSEESCIVFAATIEDCQLYTTMLDILGFSVTGLHSLQTQRQRLASLGKFRAQRAKILIATATWTSWIMLAFEALGFGSFWTSPWRSSFESEGFKSK